MSWFGSDEVVLDEAPRETVADGVTLERRSLLRLSAATVAAGLAAACAGPRSQRDEPADLQASTAPPPASDGALDIAEFLAEMRPRAQRFVASGGEREEAYLMAIGELMARLETPTPEQVRSTMRQALKGTGT